MQKKPSENPEPLSILNQIDPAIRQLVADLNKAGYETQSSCQGKRKPDDSHCNHAFVTFMPDGLIGLKRKAKRLGLFVYNGGMSISALNGHETHWDEISLKNRSFESKMRELFDI